MVISGGREDHLKASVLIEIITKNKTQQTFFRLKYIKNAEPRAERRLSAVLVAGDYLNYQQHSTHVRYAQRPTQLAYWRCQTRECTCDR